MIVGEFLAISLGNLWRLKLRSALTISGVMVGIGALVSMLSFGNGMQKNVTGEFKRMGLLRTLQVFSGPPPGVPEDKAPRHGGAPAAADSSHKAPGPPLDQQALDKIAAIPGVALVYPQESFDARIEWKGRSEAATVQALPASFTRQRPFGELHGRFFASDSCAEAVISRSWLQKRKVDPDSILGDTITVRAAGSGEIIMGLAGRELRRTGLPKGLVTLAEKFGRAVLPHFLGRTWASLQVVGTTDLASDFGFSMGSVFIPMGQAQAIDHLSFSDPNQLLTLLSSGSSSGWPMLVVTVNEERDYARVRAQIEALGFHTFSFIDRFDQIRKAFLIFETLAGALGFLALFIASLSIVNTMVMSITERTREIGILKSLGAEEGEIRLLFLVESAAIGFIGSLAGLLLGFGVSRLGALVIRRIMLAQGGPAVDPFSLSLLIAAGSVAFGTILSLLAGLYPAARAARVDPVRALRQE